MSPKNKGKFGRAKAAEETAQPDEFISGVDRVLRALKPHAMRLAIFFGVITAIVVSVTVWRWWGHRKASGATAIYARAVAMSQVPIRDTAPEISTKLPPDPRDIPAHFVTRADRSKAVLALVEDLQSEYGSTSIAKQADVLAADALFETGQYPQAAERYRAYLSHGGPDEVVTAAREGVAYALEAQAEAEKDAKAKQGGLEKALAAFEEVQPDEAGAGHDAALFHQARVLVELGRKDDAVKRFEKILTDHPNSGFKGQVELRLLALGSAPKAATPPGETPPAESPPDESSPGEPPSE